MVLLCSHNNVNSSKHEIQRGIKAREILCLPRKGPHRENWLHSNTRKAWQRIQNRPTPQGSIAPFKTTGKLIAPSPPLQDPQNVKLYSPTYTVDPFTQPFVFPQCNVPLRIIACNRPFWRDIVVQAPTRRVGLPSQVGPEGRPTRAGL